MATVLMSNEYPYLLLHTVPNDIYIASACCLGLFLAAMALRTVFSFSANPKLWNTVENARAANGMIALRWVSFLSLIVAVILAARIQEPMDYGWWERESYNKEYWNVCRIVVAAIIPICAGVFHTNPFFRFYCSFAFPLLALVDMLSEVDLMGYIHCVDSGACVNASSRDASYLWLWRDLVGITINICGTALAWFCWGYCGFCSNEIYLPPYEHRVLTNELNGMRLNKATIRKQLSDEDLVNW